MGKVYDLVVIGAGSGGVECGWYAANAHKKNVMVIDTQKHHGVPPFYSALGGTCVNVGCVPKKLMVTGANYREQLKDMKGFGWDVPDVQPNWKTLITAKNAAVLDINQSYEGMFKPSDNGSENKLEFTQGFGRLASATTVEVLDTDCKVIQTLETKNILVATGSWPYCPPFEGHEHAISSNEAFYLPECPKRTLMVGGGFIAVEFAGIFNGYKPADGQVSLCYRGDLFLRNFDTDVRKSLAEQMTKNGINLMFNENPAKIEKLSCGARRVTFESGKVEEYDVVMIATGRKPKTDGMNLDKVGVDMNKRGGVVVDKENHTNVSSVHAIGDVTDAIQLTPVAIMEGNCLAANLFTDKTKRRPDYGNIPTAVFSIPPIGTVGVLEEEACKTHKIVDVYMSDSLPLMHQLTGMAHKKFLMKVVVDRETDKVLGVHMLGDSAPEIIQAVGVAVKMGAKMIDFYSTVGVHPTSAEGLCDLSEASYTYLDGKRQASQ